MTKEKFGGVVEISKITFAQFLKLKNEKNVWYVVKGRGIKCWLLTKYVPTTLDSFYFYLKEFGEDNLPPEMQKISDDLDTYYNRTTKEK